MNPDDYQKPTLAKETHPGGIYRKGDSADMFLRMCAEDTEGRGIFESLQPPRGPHIFPDEQSMFNLGTPKPPPTGNTSPADDDDTVF